MIWNKHVNYDQHKNLQKHHAIFQIYINGDFKKQR